MNDSLLLHLSGDFGVSFTGLNIPTRASKSAHDIWSIWLLAVYSQNPPEKNCLILSRIIILSTTNSHDFF